MAGLTSDVEISKSLLQLTIVPNSLTIAAGILSVLLNLTTSIIICSSKKLRTKCFILLGANSLVNFLIGACYIGTGTLRVHRHVAGTGEVIKVWQCCLEISPMIFVQLLSLGVNTALIIERLLATFCSVRYKQWTCQQVTLPLMLGAIVFAAAQLAVHFRDSWVKNEDLLTSCSIDDTVYPMTLSILTAVQLTMSTIVVLLHGLLVYGVWKQKQKFQAAPAQLERLEADMKFIKAICVIVATHILVIGARSAVFLMNMWAAPDIRVVANRYGGLVVVASTAIDFFVLFSMSSQFREASKKMFHAGPSAVAPM